MRNFQLFIKRAFDLFCGIILLILMIIVPLLIVIPITIRLTSKGPAIFTQERIGRDGKVFKIYKFRTMLLPEKSINPDGSPMTSEQRITKVGRVLRKTSLDEIAQIFNIINGTMSIVGPRPTLPYQVERYTERQAGRHKMRPGVTGLAQVNGRNDLTWTEKIEYDLEYIEKFSLWLDIKILFRTVLVVLKQEGIAFTKPDAVININTKTPQQIEDRELVKIKGE
ncbi:MAG: sugar transferase [Clostridia bacterium]|nr:sugar transferase [Clostridia bacterium]MBR6523971.1 sugar transferase [Clostridia bacterium]